MKQYVVGDAYRVTESHECPPPYWAYPILEYDDSIPYAEQHPRRIATVYDEEFLTDLKFWFRLPRAKPKTERPARISQELDRW